MYLYDEAPKTVLSAPSQAVYDAIKSTEYAVFVGRNNCGKSFLLKKMTLELGANAPYLGPARYQNFNLFAQFAPNKARKQQKYQEYQNFFRSPQNMDNSPLNLQLAIAEMSDSRRKILQEIIKLLLGTDIEILHTDRQNSMSQQYLSAGGHNLSFTSSGFRLITTLITSLLDDSYNTFLIDEPELGISPEAQGILADFLFDSQHRAKYFSHIKTLIFATHSTIFLDRQRISNNYMMEKNVDEISIKKVSSQAEFNNIHFFLLGNRFETLYLPNIMCLVEGKSDYSFIHRLFKVKFREQRISLMSANGDNRIKEILNTVKAMLGDIQRSPYHDRIFAVLDSVHERGLKDQLVAMGVPQENVVVWSRNGIEHFYPPTILDNIFGVGGDIEIKDDLVTRNGLSYNKSVLADKVSDLLLADTQMNVEFDQKFLKLIEQKFI